MAEKHDIKLYNSRNCPPLCLYPNHYIIKKRMKKALAI
ncbi:hypothetical protein KN10_2823 [Anoxybacillus flavithermus NBRC 109594]|uniref:Uncharacterized protein n=1 Tax=Anoxybacillus flavithermus NBRC 109594 TaxID=1315967 RepID=R4G7B4_9BACL|nr:hypothetical protein KN10_2823 [Anoxybacillus flavithermus NBRC 109594]